MSFNTPQPFCPPPPSPLPLSPPLATLVGVLVILFSIVGQLAEVRWLVAASGASMDLLARSPTYMCASGRSS